jgi:hypothetical protein
MAKNKNSYDQIKLGNSTYYRINFRDTELQKLIHEWEKFGYNKFSSIEDQMEWSIMEVLLLDDIDLCYVGTSGIDYPSIPYDDIDKVGKIVDAAEKAKSLLQGFKIPKRKSNESLRLYQARVSDQLDRHLASKMDKTDASLVGDFYLARCIKDPPLGYDE